MDKAHDIKVTYTDDSGNQIGMHLGAEKRAFDDDGYTDVQRPWIELRQAWRTFVYELAKSIGVVWLLDRITRWLNR